MQPHPDRPRPAGRGQNSVSSSGKQEQVYVSALVSRFEEAKILTVAWDRAYGEGRKAYFYPLRKAGDFKSDRYHSARERAHRHTRPSRCGRQAQKDQISKSMPHGTGRGHDGQTWVSGREARTTFVLRKWGTEEAADLLWRGRLYYYPELCFQRADRKAMRGCPAASHEDSPRQQRFKASLISILSVIS